LKCGYPERFAQQALGHNSKAVHHAYSKRAEVTVPSLDDWEKNWSKAESGKQKAEMPRPAVVQVDFKAPAAASTGIEAPVPVARQAGG
jgi:hypothetical protein